MDELPRIRTQIPVPLSDNIGLVSFTELNAWMAAVESRLNALRIRKEEVPGLAGVRLEALDEWMRIVESRLEALADRVWTLETGFPRPKNK